MYPNDTFADDLNVDDLAARCRQESKQYLTGNTHDESYCLELFHRAIYHQSQPAWRAIYAQFQHLVADWVRQHSRFQHIEEDLTVLVNTAFARFWRTTSKQSRRFRFNRLGQLLQYLKSCVYSVVEDAYRRQQRQPPEVRIGDDFLEVLADELPHPEECLLNRLRVEALEWAIWSRLQTEEETIVATLSWLHGLSPKEIQAHHSNLFTRVQDVYRIKRNILDRLLRDPDIQQILGRMP